MSIDGARALILVIAVVMDGYDWKAA